MLSITRRRPSPALRLFAMAVIALFSLAASAALASNGATTDEVRDTYVVHRLLPGDRVKSDIVRNGSIVAGYEGRAGATLLLTEWRDAASGKGGFEVAVDYGTRGRATNAEAQTAAAAAPVVPVPFLAQIPGPTTPVYEGVVATDKVIVLGCNGVKSSAVTIACGPPTGGGQGASTQLAAQLGSAAGDSQANGSMYDSGRVTYNGVVYWTGGFRRLRVNESDRTSDYTADGAWGSGYGKNGWALMRGRIGFAYGTATIVNVQPNQTVPGSGSCGSRTFSIQVYGVGISQSTPVCYDYIAPRFNGARGFGAEWVGRSIHPDMVVGSAMVTSAKYKAGTTTSFRFGISGAYCDFPC